MEEWPAGESTRRHASKTTKNAGWVGQMKAPFGGGAPIQWRGEGADHFYPTMFDI